MEDSIRMTLVGHLTEAVLAGATASVADRFSRAPEKVGLVVDCREMTGYDSAARVMFVEWNRAHAPKIARVAVVTRNRLWHMVISAMSLASGQRMFAFDDLESAEAWARTR